MTDAEWSGHDKKRPADGAQPDTCTAAGLLVMLKARHQHLLFKFTTPPESEEFKVSWNGGNITADSEDELLGELLETLQDCGSEVHQWITTSKELGPESTHSVLLTQRLQCIYCDPRNRVITIPETAGRRFR